MNNDPVVRQMIMENYQKPYHQGKPEEFTHEYSLSNPNCGDEITVYLTVKDEIITEVYFEISGCALSTASASLLAQELVGKTFEEIRLLDEDYLNQLFATELTMNRVKCALLPLRAIQQSLGLRPTQQYL